MRLDNPSLLIIFVFLQLRKLAHQELPPFIIQSINQSFNVTCKIQPAHARHRQLQYVQKINKTSIDIHYDTEELHDVGVSE